MRLFIFFILLLSVHVVYAEPTVSEPPLSEQSKKHIAHTLEEILGDKDITQQQYKQAIVWLNSSPCDGVDRSLTESRKAELASAIAKQEKLKTVDVFQSFKIEGWFIIYVNTYISDEPYLFYSSNPVTDKRPVTAWSGAATIFETTDIERWVLQNAPGIPPRLASCFAWHVTLNRE